MYLTTFGWYCTLSFKHIFHSTINIFPIFIPNPRKKAINEINFNFRLDVSLSSEGSDVVHSTWKTYGDLIDSCFIADLYLRRSIRNFSDRNIPCIIVCIHSVDINTLCHFVLKCLGVWSYFSQYIGLVMVSCNCIMELMKLLNEIRQFIGISI